MGTGKEFLQNSYFWKTLVTGIVAVTIICLALLCPEVLTEKGLGGAVMAVILIWIFG